MFIKRQHTVWELKESLNSATGASSVYSQNFEIPLEISLLILPPRFYLVNQAVHRLQRFHPLCLKSKTCPELGLDMGLLGVSQIQFNKYQIAERLWWTAFEACGFSNQEGSLSTWKLLLKRNTGATCGHF